MRSQCKISHTKLICKNSNKLISDAFMNHMSVNFRLSWKTMVKTNYYHSFSQYPQQSSISLSDISLTTMITSSKLTGNTVMQQSSSFYTGSFAKYEQITYMDISRRRKGREEGKMK
uniref:Uncharacterized protein n=1 Tax=Onchocerca volvulus TaxID=6282 RepID=A0A8R1XX78_ONCVO